MSLRDTFTDVRPRETSGSRSADRFDYQKAWGLCRLLELHESGEDYVIVFDLHDDVVVFDSETDPTGIAFYQIKTNTKGPWTVTQLLATKTGKESRTPSILAKLYSNRIAFRAYTKRLTFVSNAFVAFTLKDRSSPADQAEIAFWRISDNEQTTIENKLREQCQESGDLELQSLMFFEQSAISLLDHAGHTKGKITEFLERLLPGSALRPGLVHRSLAGEITRRNNSLEVCNSFEDVCKKKALSRSAVDVLLQSMGVYDDETQIWTQIENRLNSEQYPFPALTSLRIRWQALQAARTDSGNLQLRELGRQVSSQVENTEPSESSRLTEILTLALRAIRSDKTWATFDDDDIRALALVSIYGTKLPETKQLPKVGQDPKEEEA